MSLNFTSISVEKNLRRNNNDSYEPAGMKEKTYYSTIENKLIRYEISEQPKNILIKKPSYLRSLTPYGFMLAIYL